MAETSSIQKKYFLSFADSRMSKATDRIAMQAAAMNCFDGIYVLSEKNLADEFLQRWGEVMRASYRGFGYWCWKPYIIRQVLEKLQDNEILLYCDAGCHLNVHGRPRLMHYFQEVCEDSLGIKAFPAYSTVTDVRERRWTKGDVFDYFKCRDRKDITDTKQLASGHIFLRKSEKVMQFVREWEKVWYEDFSLVDDSPSKTDNLHLFLENRHDQSIFSVLYKLYGAIPFPDGETEHKDYSQFRDYPFWDMRDKGYKDKRFSARLKRFYLAKLMQLRLSREKVYAFVGRFFSCFRKED